MDGKCAHCGFQDRVCRFPGGRSPEFCSTMLYQDALKVADAKYNDAETLKFASEAAKQECAGYAKCPDNPDFNMPTKPRIIEIIEFCKRMGYTRVGLAFCGGLMREGALASEILESHGLEVVSAMCKVGGVDKSRLGIGPEDKIIGCDGHETMCNPIGQAEVLNAAKTQFNIMLGLCVGHDSLFLKNSEAMCTVLAAKDRLMGHNPLAALYTSKSYYRYVKK